MRPAISSSLRMRSRSVLRSEMRPMWAVISSTMPAVLSASMPISSLGQRCARISSAAAGDLSAA